MYMHSSEQVATTVGGTTLIQFPGGTKWQELRETRQPASTINRACGSGSRFSYTVIYIYFNIIYIFSRVRLKQRILTTTHQFIYAIIKKLFCYIFFFYDDTF